MNAALQAAHAEKAAIETERASLAAELEETRRERARREEEMNAALQAAHAEKAAIETERASLAELELETRRERARREEEMNAALQAALAEKAATGSKLAVLTRDLEHSRAAAAEVSQTLLQKEKELTDEIERAGAENALAAARLDERFREIGTLTTLLADSEASVSHSREQVAWLQEVSSVLVAHSNSLRGRLQRLLPAMIYYKRQQQLLNGEGTF